MARKILEAKEPRCEYCMQGRLSADGESVLCPKKGVMDKDFSCKKFKYDPLKRVPEKKAPRLPEFTADDFSL